MATNILQKPILTDFLYPFLLMFFIVFAILEKTKILGDDKHQLNAGISLVIGLIFVSAVFPKIVVGNLILFLVVGLVVIFVGLMLWGFISGGVEVPNKMKVFLAILVAIALVLVVIWSTGFGGGIESIFDFLFNSSWSGDVWTNVLVIALILGAIAIVVVKKKAA